MLLINCKIHFELNWSSNCVMSAIADNIQNNKHKLIRPNCYSIRQRQGKTGKLLEEGIKRPVYWNVYQTKVETRNLDNNTLTGFLLDDSFQGVRRLFVPVFNSTVVNVPNNPINNTNNIAI